MSYGRKHHGTLSLSDMAASGSNLCVSVVLTIWHMQTLSFLTAEKPPSQQGLQTQFQRLSSLNDCRVIPVGSNHIGTHFQLAVINRIFQDMDRVSLEGISGLDMTAQLKKARIPMLFWKLALKLTYP
jgi:hypothetical protein